ncbi:MAG: Formyl trans protein [Patescibacteria group bacterium]|nr:Formyl trans protein [Patescibacteria group bacterium]
MSKKISIAVAGSTQRTVLCAEALRTDDRFEVTWVLTPVPKIIGRKKALTQNPLHHWAEAQAVSTILLEKKIDNAIKDAVLASDKVDFLLVVDFGYLVPKWLLELPQRAPLNIHPSLLPRWRGSSPGQFVLLYGEKESAVTLMVMDEDLDSGPVIAQLPFVVQPTWTQTEYYQHSFGLIQEQLPDLIADFAEGKTKAIPQPPFSPTPIARRLSREDGFIEWDSLTQLMTGSTSVVFNPLLNNTVAAHASLADLVSAACKAFTPWPGLWTVVNDQRLKILSCHAKDQQLVLDEVQLEGKQPTTWGKLKSQVL